MKSKIKEEKEHVTTLRIKPELYEGLRKWAFDDRLPINSIIHKLISDALIQRNGKKK